MIDGEMTHEELLKFVEEDKRNAVRKILSEYEDQYKWLENQSSKSGTSMSDIICDLITAEMQER